MVFKFYLLLGLKINETQHALFSKHKIHYDIFNEQMHDLCQTLMWADLKTIIVFLIVKIKAWACIL